MIGHGDVEALAEARARLTERIELACARAGRDPGTVTLVAVTKTVTVERIRAAVAAGFSTLGENRVQEAADKIPQIAGARWHLIGPLQSNKAGRALDLFDVVETVDSLALARRLDRLCEERRRDAVPILLQVNVDEDPAKSGYRPADLAADLPALAGLPRLRLLGLMTVGRLVSDPEQARPTFRRLRELSERLRGGHGEAFRVNAGLGPALSMGMSDDFEVAVEEGATHVRIGRAIFGERPTAG
jgi:pyridoxal phosphate enzyme (YggS family)